MILPRHYPTRLIRTCALLALAGVRWGSLHAGDDQPDIQQPMPLQEFRLEIVPGQEQENLRLPRPFFEKGVEFKEGVMLDRGRVRQERRILVQNQIIRQVGGIGFGLFVKNGGDGEEDDAANPPAPDPAGPQVLEFTDGTLLHGTLTTLDTAPGQLGWQRADASVPFTFPLADIGRLTLHDGTKPETNPHATVKLTGGDWLAADVTGLAGPKIQLELSDGSPVSIDRDKVEWIYFSKGSAPECYDGPTSFAGWISAGGWAFRDGALRAVTPAAIGREFEALPDQTEYFLEVDQGKAGHAFTLILHSQNVVSRGRATGAVQLMFRGSELQMWAQSANNNMKAEHADLTKLLPGLGDDGVADRKPVQFRVFEDFPGGRIIVFVNGRKVADWKIGEGEAGANRGGVSFQPQGWNADSEQIISQFRVAPWDGRVPEDNAPTAVAAETDLVALAEGEAKTGTIESLNGERVKLHTADGTVELPRAKVVMLRFRRTEHPPDEDPPVARVRLAQRGEFDVTGVSFRQGKFTLRTTFTHELTLAPAALRGLDFSRSAWVAPKPADELVFRNGDRLRGRLESVAAGHKLRWHTARSDTLVEIEPSGLAGIAFAAPEEEPESKPGVVARLRNGDLLGGSLIKFDTENLVLDCAPAGQFAISRDQTQALYFSADGKLPVLDGGARRETWLGVENDANGQTERTTSSKNSVKAPKEPSAWRSFDGAFTYTPAFFGRANVARTGSLRLTTEFNAMPQLVELSFDVVASKPPVAFSAQLFADANNPGYLLQLYAQGLYIYDMGARQQARFGGQQQMQFGDKVKPNARQRHIRVLADRRLGRLTVLVDGAVIGQLGQKAGAPPRNLGRNVVLTNTAPGIATFANLWIGPWNGQPAGLAAAPDAPPHTVLLANGDETHGTVGSVTTEVARIDSEAGAIELPTARLVAIDFGGTPAPRPPGTHLRLADWGALTVKSFRVEKDEIIARSDLIGEFKLPRSAVREIVFGAKDEGRGAKGESKE